MLIVSFTRRAYGQLTILVRELSINTDVIIEAAVLQLRLLLVQVGQLLVALHGPGLCNVTVFT